MCIRDRREGEESDMTRSWPGTSSLARTSRTTSLFALDPDLPSPTQRAQDGRGGTRWKGTRMNS
eukprot:35820-Hanusia_phi.AAC.2